MSKKNILTNIWKFSATRSVALMLIIPTVGSLVALITFYFFLNQTKGDVMFIDVASRQRILSEQIGNYVHMVYDMGQEDDREPLRELVVAFDQYLAIIDQGGEIMGRRLSPSPPEIRDKIDIGKQLWKDLMPALL
ncbi:MAG TPA: hypothetical protein ENH49_03710, partial [Candidatus Marinimicrobia bacterium]|nr:hypothetical protein [Candidatus Neomarinimicrobiota bacterium]